MKILVVSSYLPYPLFSGGHVRLYNILKQLSENNDLTLICEKRDYQSQKEIGELNKICKEVITVDRRKQWSIVNILKTAFSLYPFLLIGHRSLEMEKKIKDILDKEKFDLIHVETFYVMQNLPKTNLPVVLTEHNIEYLVYKRFADKAFIFVKPFLYLDILKIKYWENKFWKKATKLIAVSEEEKKLMKRKDVVVVQNGVDEKNLTIKSAGWRTKFKQQKKILFIGDFKWLQNRDAVGWILKKIWPLVNAKVKALNEKVDLKLWIVGRQIPDEIKKIEGENVIFDENAPKETADIYNQADLLLAPIRIGGGTSFKILESMACGIPVITTKLGIEGIDATDGKEVLVAETEEDLASLVFEIIFNDNAYEKLTKSARKLIEEKYTWSAIVKKLERVYQSALS